MVNQFIITKYHREIPNNWNHVSIGSFYLTYDSSLSLCQLKSKNKIIGYFLGLPIHEDYGLLKGGHDDNLLQSLEKIESFLTKVSGRYIFLLNFEDYLRLYPDPGNTLSIVYSQKLKSISSNPLLINPKALEQKDEFLFDNRSNNYIPFGLTSFKDIFRLLPNHYIDLKTWKVIRFFPSKDGSFEGFDNRNEFSDTVFNILKNQLDHIISKYDQLYMTLTGGNDNRMMLCAGFDYIQNFIFFTNSRSKKIDLHLVNKMRKGLGLKHYYIDYSITEKTEKILEKEYISGYCANSGMEKRIFHHRQQLPVKKNAIQLSGGGGEILRNIYNPISNNKTITPDRIVSLLFNDPKYKEYLLANYKYLLEDWLNELYGMSLTNFQIMKLLYWEFDFGCRPGPNMYLIDEYTFPVIQMFNSWKIINIGLNNYPPEKGNNMANQIMKDYCPSLSKYPINNYSDIRKHLVNIAKFIKKRYL